MPVDQTHAFGRGPTESVAAKRKKTWWKKVLRGWLKLLRSALAEAEMEEVMQSFRNGCAAPPSVRLGPNAWCVNRGKPDQIRLGKSVICRGLLRLEAFEEAKLTIGENVYIGDDTVISCARKIDIGRLTMIAHGVQIFDNDSHPLDPDLREQDYLTLLGRIKGQRPPIASAPVIIGERVWIGMNSLVMKGVSIGSGSVVAAGSVVTKDVPPMSLAAGVPARIVGTIA